MLDDESNDSLAAETAPVGKDTVLNTESDVADPDSALPRRGCVEIEALARPRTVPGDADAA